MINEDNVIINTPEKELETEPQNIPQGEKPFINPNPGYGEDGETKPAIKTEPVSGERGIRSEVVTPLKEGIKVEQKLVNFLKGLLIKGKPIEEYIDSQGGVTEEELQAALTPIRAQLGNIDLSKFPKSESDPDALSSEEVEQFKGTGWYSVASDKFMFPLYVSETEVYFVTLIATNLDIYYYIFDDDEWAFEDHYNYDLENMAGTKLYHHYIKLSNGNELMFNSPASGTITQLSAVAELFNSGTPMCVYYDPTGDTSSVLCMSYDSPDLMITFYSHDGSQINEFGVDSIISDTVTPL